MPPVKSNPKVSDFTSLVNVAHLLYHVYDVRDEVVLRLVLGVVLLCSRSKF